MLALLMQDIFFDHLVWSIFQSVVTQSELLYTNIYSIGFCHAALFLLVHSLILYEGNSGFLGSVDMQKILNTKKRRPRQ